MKSIIKIYGRLKPNSSNTNTEEYHICHHEETSTDILTLNRFLWDSKLNKGERLAFRFHKVFDQMSKQRDIFDTVARPVVASVLCGYNGTVFAYGQTGSGKTFTITGGINKHEDRGIIPRTIQYVFQSLQQQQNISYTLYVSYLEIYNESGFDLLDPRHTVLKLEDLPHITLLEDSSGNLHLRNLSMHLITTEQEAMDLLLLGENNRVVADTPMNSYSSRSHCVFTLHITSQNSLNATIRCSKLNLVDLAGSERVYKSQIDGKTLVEARHINLSLHFLEQVILALAETSRVHIPYRNSMMTTILRDSLGGNCLTVMIATLNLNKENLEETISTCRFAQRVALVHNDVNLNEAIDPQQEIIMLREEIKKLRSELEKHNVENISELSSNEISECHKLVNQYLQNESETEFVLLPHDKKVQLCFNLLKSAVIEARHKNSVNEISKERVTAGSPSVEECQQIIKQRDTEISILISLLKKEKKKYLDAMVGKENVKSNEADSQFSETGLHVTSIADLSSSQFSAHECDELTEGKSLSNAKINGFAYFMSHPENRLQIDNYKMALKARYEEAKNVATDLQQIQDTIRITQNAVIQHTEDYNKNLASNRQLIAAALKKLDTEQINYREKLQKLQTIRFETDRLKDVLQKVRLTTLINFHTWWKTQTDHVTSDNFGTETHKSSFNDNTALPGTPDSHSQVNGTPQCKETTRTNMQPEYKKKISNYATDCESVAEVLNCQYKELLSDDVNNAQRVSHSSCDMAHDEFPIQEGSYIPGISLYNEGTKITRKNVDCESTFSDQSNKSSGRPTASIHTNEHYGKQNTGSVLVEVFQVKCNENPTDYFTSADSERYGPKKSSPETLVQSTHTMHENNDYNKCSKETNHAINSNKNNGRSDQQIKIADNCESNQSPVSRPTGKPNDRDTSQTQQILNVENLPLTGDPEIDEEIIAFYRSRSKIIQEHLK